jgi:hypothetical protein
MNTEQLIDSLAQTVQPVSRRAMRWRLASGILLGSAVTLLLIAAPIGFRDDLDEAMLSFSFWMKWAYTGSLATCAIAATVQIARPDAPPLSWIWVAAVPVAGLSVVSGLELANSPASHWLEMWLGGSWDVCSVLIFLLSLPIFAGLLWSFRRFAPTRLRAAGATAGLTAGAWAATLYCLHCPEVSAIFVLTWYTLGIALAALLGALLGPRLLRW